MGPSSFRSLRSISPWSFAAPWMSWALWSAPSTPTIFWTASSAGFVLGNEVHRRFRTPKAIKTPIHNIPRKRISSQETVLPLVHKLLVRNGLRQPRRKSEFPSPGTLGGVWRVGKRIIPTSSHIRTCDKNFRFPIEGPLMRAGNESYLAMYAGLTLVGFSCNDSSRRSKTALMIPLEQHQIRRLANFQSIRRQP